MVFKGIRPKRAYQARGTQREYSSKPLKGRTIRKVMGGGGWGKNQKKIHARENAKKKIHAKKKLKKKKSCRRKVQL